MTVYHENLAFLRYNKSGGGPVIDLTMNKEVLLSVINTKLRNDFRSLDELCEEMELDLSVLSERLKTIHYVYNPKTNQFVYEEPSGS